MSIFDEALPRMQFRALAALIKQCGTLTTTDEDNYKNWVYRDGAFIWQLKETADSATICTPEGDFIWLNGDKSPFIKFS